jgi:hypothetical protein
MECARCQHKNRAAAKFCDECGRGLPRRRKRRHAKQNDVAAAIIVVLVGVALVVGTIMGSPRWRTIIATWRENSEAWLAKVSPATEVFAERATWPTGDGAPALGVSTGGIQQEPARHDGLESRGSPIRAPNLARSAPVVPNSTQAPDLTRPVTRSPTVAKLDDEQVMGRLLIAQLGQDTAWRTALANAKSHAFDSPEFGYWHRVAAAIREESPGPGR